MRATVAQRPSSIVPQQYLFLMNSRFMVERAKSLVALLATASESDAARIEHAYDLLYCRSPEPMELQLGLEFLTSPEDANPLSRWDRYAQVLLSSNEFMFVR